MKQAQTPAADSNLFCENGFVLPLTLWIIALFGLGVAASHAWISVSVENARTLQQKVEAELETQNMINELVFAMGTRPMSNRGLEVGTDLTAADMADPMSIMGARFESSNYIAFDGRPYAFEGNADYVFHLQDGRGLIKLHQGAGETIRRLLSAFDVPETLKNQLPDTLVDWVDDDDLTRLAGAEKSEYERLRRLPPTNQNLLTPMEAQSILGWDEIPQIWEADLRSPLFSTCRVTGFNPNTASETALLAHVAGLTKPAAAQVIEKREESPFQHAREFMAAAGFLTAAQPFFFSVVPGNCVVIDAVHRESGRRTRYSISLVPTSLNRPWQVDYAFEIPSQFTRSLDGDRPLITFPTPEALNPVGGNAIRTSGVR